jgi:hypothetical protein
MLQHYEYKFTAHFQCKLSKYGNNNKTNSGPDGPGCMVDRSGLITALQGKAGLMAHVQMHAEVRL